MNTEKGVMQTHQLQRSDHGRREGFRKTEPGHRKGFRHKLGNCPRVKEMILHLFGSAVLSLERRGYTGSTLVSLLNLGMDYVECSAEEGGFAKDNIFCFRPVCVQYPFLALEPDQSYHPGFIIKIGRQPPARSCPIG